MRIYQTTVFFLLFLLISVVSNAQNNATNDPLEKLLASDVLLNPLIDSAIKNSPEIRRVAGSEAFATANMQISKKAIFSAVSLLSSYNYGTNFTSVANQTGNNNLTTAQTGFYNLGVGIQLPLSQLLNRKNLIKAGQSQIEMANAEKSGVALMVKQEVIRLYQAFKLAHHLMSINNNNKQASKVNYTLAEKEFLNGQLTVDQLSRVQELYNKSVIEFETSVNTFQTTYMQLEAYTGIKLSPLINQFK
ncbi:MAG: TolC family protein [Ferruginibacter sp.]